MRSTDGLNWTVEKPIPVDYDGVTPSSFEFGGTEKMENGKNCITLELHHTSLHYMVHDCTTL